MQEISADPRATKAAAGKVMIKIYINDGRVLDVPCAMFPKLAEATPAQKKNLEITGNGKGLRWPDIDEDLSVAGLLWPGQC